ncbi:DUF4331 family protein [Hamadaea tsunoensis]|uniref:DUF4331 family protein n=1 Tax=Hamadaea tsunoensis TaxID=53368 RepID=UPI000427CB86|nr:DUF4331 family protein [Hamadaea tsunoensis]
MSHHLDSPLARQDPRLNITDQYVFDADGATVFVMDTRTSLAADQHPDAFHPEARYEFKIHLDGAEREAITYRFAFDATQDGAQAYTVWRLDGPAAQDDAATGTVVATGRTGDALSTDDGGRIWAGTAVEPFYLDLSQLDAVDQTVLHGGDADLTHWVAGVARDTFTGSTVNAIVLAIPVGTGGLTAGRRISAWSTTKLATDAGGWRQAGRTGLPMIWPIFRDADSDLASESNTTHPADDVTNYRQDVIELIASVVRRRGTSDRPDEYAKMLADRIVPDLMAYEVGSAALFGFAGFNGRRLADNAPEIMFSLATNSAIPGGLKAGDVKRSQETFPYVLPAGEK